MTEAKLGLIVVSVIIIAFAFAMRRFGALQTTGVVATAIITVAIAASLFLTQ
ncbi:MAG: hypothetical protein QM576_07875 [Rhodopseudomonas sp.]|jgi:hypothetical protein|uniref:hypothetical protein n=1 Tax=Rhodopseudomonas TaxID=1073 RepID=UPI000164B7EB|nr:MULTISPECIES: hypothetical protein [Rhodopseudomonas]ACF00167.1 conserved hypothetical protein; putative signal peptide [Rhodopseudomonas palustris TIE-1]AVT75489.1 hypothetical protein RPPS3_14260 [Rhodopseudomonas palustris]QLH70558.1 hypothetical protein HZF03_07095 [Rhodopseudomonas palustris]UYO45795.1 hypothetical protein KQX63_07200 [Rhodopseudomonas palustris]UYO55262.1 hypothetical protein KQX61_07610 [Rhodopseudomonas palustris]